MQRYIVRPRVSSTAVAADTATMVQSYVAARSVAGANVVRSRPTSHHVVRLPESDAGDLAAARPDLIVEMDEPLQLLRMPGLPPMMPEVAEETIDVRVRDEEGAPISDCTVYAIGPHYGFKADTDDQGRASLHVEADKVERIVVSPRAGFWSHVSSPPEAGARVVEATLKAMDPVASSEWIHRLLGVSSLHWTLAGRGVKIAVVDSGIAAVPGLDIAGGVNTLDGADPEDWSTDEQGHGTHCAGIIAARPSKDAQFRGIAPLAELLSVKVFPGGFISDLIEAVDWCREQRVDLVNMSLGGQSWSEALALAIEQATASGVTIVAATGNDATTVAFPAAHPDVIAVAAVGRFGSFPGESAHSLKIGRWTDWAGGIFNASFNNFGPEVSVCAPGVAIPSTVPQGYAAWDGTSMACPAVTALLALALEASPALRTGDRSQPDALRWIAAAGAASTGMPSVIQGTGLPTAPRILAATRQLVGAL